MEKIITENIDTDIHRQLKDFFGFKKFKGHQEQAIKSILNGEDTFVIMPTGGGKSLCYQLPAILSNGVAIIISPLIALMKNQVDSIRSYSNDKNIAHFLNSSLGKDELESVKEAILTQKTRLLFVAPETISKEKNLMFLKNIQISFYAIDEAHCISEWGHDFRPEYRKLKSIINKIGRKPIIALTATATQQVQKDIIKSLGFEQHNLFLSSFNRPNLYYEIRENSDAKKDIVKYVKENNSKSGIIYCLSRKSAEEISELLNLNNINSLPYHAGLDKSIRKETQESFLMEKINVVVATIAFGMGIDKPDVRYVIHYNLPKSLENYYQETGRAGRDGGDGHCILFYDSSDVEKFMSFNTKKNIFEKEISMQLLEDIVDFVESADCRRKKILHYFGEEYQKSDCNKNCDNCQATYQYQDESQKFKLILNTIKKESKKYDIKELTLLTQDYINMNNTEQIKQNSVVIKQIIRKAIIENFIIKEVTSHGQLYLSNKGESYLMDPKPFLIQVKKPKNLRAKTETTKFNSQLLSTLKKIREEIAKSKSIPPFLVFQEFSLKDMALQYPTNNEELYNIIGVGKGKAQKYGEPFITAIKQYITENNIDKKTDYVIKSKPKKNDLKIFIIQSADRKRIFDDIIEEKNITLEELIEEIENIVNSGTKINIDYHINEILDIPQQEEISDYFLNEADNDSIIDAKKYFDNEYDEYEIRLMKIKLFSDLAN